MAIKCITTSPGPVTRVIGACRIVHITSSIVFRTTQTNGNARSELHQDARGREQGATGRNIFQILETK
ncbi:hypothetical protein MPTK1_7g17630 [Marchantia polymorpha subsp. ruderalis]|uniref:Uncharacterized protein n=2 Tax=Marchantia polymorpha TaxID=3197 RepID=A0AAF6C0U2_MARPO|nr:hypothetical protein MARPO_0051s0100 [Marchantia polymorpha]BBN17876.1 hypothetical protein Mp_7g17630 [Marchantia polymorpha subsp. ruderalis]|eukprot:PTQ38501.1 hypothetical protein MARPO_0051s0100 [Marchantia polymorpha]